MFDRSALVKLQLRDKKGKWIKMGDHVKWHSLEDNADVSGIARGESGNNIIVEFSKGGKTYHINVPHNKIEAIQEKAHLDSAYVEKMGGHTNTPGIHDVGVSVSPTMTHYGVTSKDSGTKLTTKVSDLKPGDVVYPIMHHTDTTPKSIQKSPYNVKAPASSVNLQKNSHSGHGVVQSVAKDDATGLPKYASITDENGKTHHISASHHVVTQHDTLDKAVLDTHATETQAFGHETPNKLTNSVKGVHTTQDHFEAAKAATGTTMEVPGAGGEHVVITKTGEDAWKNESNGLKLSDEVANHMVNSPAPEKIANKQYLGDKAENPLGDNFKELPPMSTYQKGDVAVLKDGSLAQWIGKGQLELEDGSKVSGNKFSVDGSSKVIAGKDIAKSYRPISNVVTGPANGPFGEGFHSYSFDLSKPNNENFKAGDLVVYGKENNQGKIFSVNPTNILVEKLNSDKTVHGTATIVAGQVHGKYVKDASASKDAHVDPNAPIDISKWTKQGGSQMGSNPGGIYTDESGKQWYVKLSQSDDHARTEVLADQLYADSGVDAAGLRLANVGGGKLGTASPMIDGAKADLSHHLNDKTYMDKIREGFAVDAWLANWDVAGAVYDNIITDGHGNPVRVDPGGALQYRAQGSPKGDAFSNKADEWDTLRNKPGATSTALFGSMTDQQLISSAEKVAAFDDKKIDDKVDSLGFDKATSDMLKERLKARRDDIVSRADALKPGAAKEPEKVPEAPQAPAEDHPAYDALDLFAMPNGAHFSSNENGVKGGYYKKGELWYMSFDPNDTSNGTKVPAHAVVTTLANNPSFKLVPGSDKKNVSDVHTPTSAPFSTSESGPGTPFYDKLSASDKAALAEDPSHNYSYGYDGSTDPHRAFPGYNDAEANNVDDFVVDSGGINAALRSGDPGHYNFEIAAIDQVLDKSPLVSDTVVYRGLNARDTIINAVMAGSYTDAGYSSTSIDPKVGHNWIGFTPSNKTPLFMEIHLPAGFKAHKIDYNALDSGHSYTEEEEVILPHGTVYTVSHKEEYTNADGQKGWKVTVTPILDEHNFDTGGNHDAGKDNAAAGPSTAVHDAGGPDSGLQPGGNEDHAGPVSGPAGTAEEESKEPVAPATAPAASDTSAGSFHPDFNATYADKGKDQIDANGDTIKVNDLVLHPKKGVGKVFIGLPSTKSVKVVYQDGSKGTHLSKAVTKVDGAAPSIPELPSDLKVGDSGIDPATHTKYIVGKNNSLIHIGDQVTHSNGDTGVALAIYGGDKNKTVSVKWDNGTTSTKKSSVLESGSKHSADGPTAPAETAPAAPTESAPEIVAPEATAVSGEKWGPSSKNASELPVGSTLTNPNSGWSLKKIADDQWQESSAAGNIYDDSKVQSTFKYEGSKVLGLPQDNHSTPAAEPQAPEVPAVAEPQASAPASEVSPEAIEGKKLNEISTPLDQLPVGTTITADNHNHAFRKLENGDWQAYKQATGNDMFSKFSSSQLKVNLAAHASEHTVHEPKAEDPSNKAAVDASNHAPAGPVSTPVIDFAGKTPEDLAKLSPEDFAKVPVGTTMHKGSYSNYFQKKIADNQWQMMKVSTGQPAFGHTNPDHEIHQMLQNSPGLYETAKAPETASDEATPIEVATPSATPSMLHAPSLDKLDKLPDGTILTDPTLEGFTFTKNGDVWDQHGPSGQNIGLSPASIADGSSYNVTMPASAPTLPSTPMKKDLNAASAHDLHALPTGTKLTLDSMPTTTWTKNESGNWSVHDHYNGHAGTVSSELLADGDSYHAEYPSSPVDTSNTSNDGKSLAEVVSSGAFKDLPTGSEIHWTGGNTPVIYKKTGPNAWQKIAPQLDPEILHDDTFDTLPTSFSNKYTIKDPSTTIAPEPSTTPTEQAGAAALTGTSTGHEITKEALDAQPVGTSMKKESSYGSSAFYYVKQADNTWKLFKNGQEKGVYTSDNMKTGSATATFGVPTSGSKFFYSKSGEITYAGDKIDYKGASGKVTSITDTGLIAVKLDGESKAKYKVASQILKTPTYGQKDAPTYHPPATPDLSTTPSSESHTGGTETLNFAGASSAAYDQQGLSMPATTNDSHLSSGLTLAPSHKADTSNPLHGTPEPQPPTTPDAYPAFNADTLAEPLPKWDSAAWLEKVKERYANNPHKVAAKLEDSKNWSKIQTVLNGDEIHLDTLLQSMYLDEALKNEAIQGIVAQEQKNKPLLEAHNAKLVEAKKQYDAAKAEHLAKYEQQKQEYSQKLSQWIAANPNDKAISAIQLPDTSKDSFTGGPADWSKAHSGTFSAQSVFDAIKKDDRLGTKGLSIATDSDQVEALDANVMKILDTSGKPVLQVKMKLTGPYGAAFEKTLKNQEGVTKTSGIFSNHLVADPATGLLKDHGQPDTGGWVHQGTRYSWTDPSTGAVIDFQRSAEQGMNVSANNNTVRIHLPANATPEDYQKVLENMGVNAKPSTEGDIRVLAENQLLSMMGKSTVNAKIYDGNINLSGTSRANQLQQIKEKYGITPDDMLFTSEANGRVRFFLNDDKAQALTDKYGVKSFVHSVSGYGADTWLNMLVGPNNGLLSTFHRWNEGIGGNGMSSTSDHAYGSSDYVYVTPKASVPSSGHGSSVVINPKAIFRRTDWWANTSDSYGKKGSGTSTSPYNTLDNITNGSAYHGGLHEALPKDSVPVSDWMYVNMDAGTRLEVIKGLQERGVLQINGIPVEDFIRTYSTPATTPATASMPTVG